MDFKKVSFPEPCWYSRGLKNTIFKWDGDSWTGETKIASNDSSIEEHLNEVNMINSELSQSKKSRTFLIIGKVLPPFVASSGVAAAIWYQHNRKS